MASHPEAQGDQTQIPCPAPGNTARLSHNLTSLKIALPSLYFAGWLDLQLNFQISTNHNSKATILAKVSGESSLPKSKTKLYPSPAQGPTWAAEGIPHPAGTLQPRVSANVSLEGPRAAAKHHTLPSSLQRTHGPQPEERDTSQPCLFHSRTLHSSQPY